MKINLTFLLAAVLMVAPLATVMAADKAAEKEAAQAESGSTPTPEQLKARKNKKPSYTKLAEAKAVAEKCNLPLIVGMFPDGNKNIQFLKQKVIGRKEFLKDFAAQNCVLLFMRIKPNGRDPEKIDQKPLKDDELAFLKNFAVSARAIGLAKQQKRDEPTFKDMSNYPDIIVVDPMCQKELFRFAPYDQQGGFGVWLVQIVDSFKTAGIEPTISPIVQKIIDNPDEPKKWK